MLKKLVQLVLALSMIISIAIVPNGGSKAALNNPATDWYSQGVYGIDLNIYEEPGYTHEQIANMFDVNLVANQAEQIGASFVQLSIGQNSGYYWTPNSKYDYYAGYTAGQRCSIRDIPMELADALAAKGIKLFIYVPSNPPQDDAQARAGFGWPGTGNDPPTQTSIQRWGEVVKEWADRYGNKLAGFWYDGCANPQMYTGTYDFNYFLNTCSKSSNPNRLVCMNSHFYLWKTTDYEDFTAGESNDMKVLPTGRWYQGLQWQTYQFIGNAWNGSTPAYTNTYLIDYLKTCKYFGAVCTLNIGCDHQGNFAPALKSQLLAVKSAIKDNAGTSRVLRNASGLLSAVYSGSSWSNSTGRDYGYWASGYTTFYKLADINFDAMVATANNDYVEYTFNGTGVSYITETSPDEGNVDVYIDGIFKQTVNCYSAAKSYNQYVYSISELANGTHKIKLVKKSGQYMLVDAFGVEGYSPEPVPPATKITITNIDTRNIENLTVSMNFYIDGYLHTDSETVGNFDKTINLGLNGANANWNGSIYTGNLLYTEGTSSGSKVAYINKRDSRLMTSCSVTVSFYVNGYLHTDYEDIGSLSTDISLKLDGINGTWDGTKYTGNFLRP